MDDSNNPMPSSVIAFRKKLTSVLQWVVILLMATLVLDVIWGVVSRYALGQQAKWSEELARLLLVWVSLFGASVAFSMKAHLGLDYFVEKLDPSARKLNRVIGSAITLTFAVAVFLVGGWTLVESTMASGQTMVALPIPKWVEYAALPVSGVFMVIFLLEQFVVSCLAPVESLEEKEAAQ